MSEMSVNFLPCVFQNQFDFRLVHICDKTEMPMVRVTFSTP